MNGAPAPAAASARKRYAFSPRWRIVGQLTTRTSLHVGSGETTTRDGLLNEKTNEPCEIQQVTLDYRGKPCIPGTAIKGVLRAWAEACQPNARATIDCLFGDPEVELPGARSGRAEFLTATLIAAPPSAEHIPYWDAQRATGVLSHVCIDRSTGAAEAEKLYFEEYVPPGTAFQLEIVATGVSEAEIAFLLGDLQHGANHPTHPYQFGANGADGWGRVDWRLEKVTCIDKSSLSLHALLGPEPLTQCEKPMTVQPATLNAAVLPYLALEVTLSLQGPFLVNDASRVKTTAGANDGSPDFAPLRTPDGGAWLPASSFRGALRQRAELLLQTIDPSAGANAPPIERIFGKTTCAARLTIEDFRQTNRYIEHRQDFVAIDRFTGGAADGAKFDAVYVDQPTFASKLVLETNGLEGKDIALLAQALRGLMEGRLTFGFGAAKGYGAARATVANVSLTGGNPDLRHLASLLTGGREPDALRWINGCLALLQPEQGAAIAAPPAATTPTADEPSESLQQGRLVVESNPPHFQYSIHVDQGGKAKRRRIREADIDVNLQKQVAAEPGIDVEFVTEGNELRKVRPRGQRFKQGAAMPLPSAAVGQRRFIHPYYFLPTKERTDTAFAGSELGDRRPASHSRLEHGRYSGTLRVQLTTETPLLICDDENVDDVTPNGHKTYKMRTADGSPTGTPALASSSVRGMLRSAYEAITNSRFGVFPGTEATTEMPAEKHGRRLGFRLAANKGLDTVPVRIVQHNGALAVELLPGTSALQANGLKAARDPVLAAWCGCYGSWVPAGLAGVSHGTEVWAYLTPWRYDRMLSGNRHIRFDFWNVEEIRPNSPSKPGTPPTILRPSFGRAAAAAWGSPDWCKGFLCITLNNMDQKHDERLFFAKTPLAPVPLTPTNRHQWRELIQNYQDEHREELKDGKTCPPVLHAPRVFSRHISAAPPALTTSALELQAGDLCYAEVERAAGNWRIKALYPVMISRKLYQKSPLDCLPVSLRPAKEFDQLSPADRVFGWVSQYSDTQGTPAYRGNVRVGPVRCADDAAVITFPNGPIPLAILGQPKSAQGRFYLGKADGTAQEQGTKEDSGYTGTNRIRGPKVYPHHAGFTPDPSRASAEWRRPDRDKQNRSITGWIQPGTVFEFDLHVKNLSQVELGALVWLLSMPSKCFLRLGLGKPLGFGSVRAEIAAGSLIADGTAWAQHYSRWDAEPPTRTDLDVAKEAFCGQIEQVNPAMLKAFLKAAVGFQGAIHYPRTMAQNAGSGEHYEWFVANERDGRQVALPDLLTTDCSLPRDP